MDLQLYAFYFKNSDTYGPALLYLLICLDLISGCKHRGDTYVTIGALKACLITFFFSFFSITLGFCFTFCFVLRILFVCFKMLQMQFSVTVMLHTLISLTAAVYIPPWLKTLRTTWFWTKHHGFSKNPLLFCLTILLKYVPCIIIGLHWKRGFIKLLVKNGCIGTYPLFASLFSLLILKWYDL